MVFEVQIFGANSATPAYGRNQTSQLLNINHNYFLIDCGEGTQMRLIQHKVKLHKIEHIFISHLHGDHYLGLVGLISTMNLQSRKVPLHIYGPRGLADIITIQLKYSGSRLNFDIEFHEVIPNENYLLLDHPLLTVFTIPLEHRIACSGFLFKEKLKQPRLDKEMLPEDIRIQDLLQLKEGKDVLDENGQVIYASEEYTLPPLPSHSYAYCSDTRYSEAVIASVSKADMLYHEATFLHDKKERAAETFHTTARQAGEVAKKAGVGKLILGHFSARYRDLTPVLHEAQAVFPNTVLAIEGSTITLH